MTIKETAYEDGFDHGRQFERVAQKTKRGARLEADLMGITAAELRERDERLSPIDNEEVK